MQLIVLQYKEFSGSKMFVVPRVEKPRLKGCPLATEVHRALRLLCYRGEFFAVTKEPLGRQILGSS